MKATKKRGRPSTKIEKTKSEDDGKKSKIQVSSETNNTSGRPSRNSAGKKVFDDFVCFESKKRKLSDKTEETSSNCSENLERTDQSKNEERTNHPIEKPRRPGRPKKSMVNKESPEASAEPTANGNPPDSPETPKKYPGRPKKTTGKPAESGKSNKLSESSFEIPDPEPKRGPKKSTGDEPPEASAEPTANGNPPDSPETPKKHTGRPKKTTEKPAESEKSNKLSESSFEIPDPEPKRRAGRPKSVKNEVDNELETELSDSLIIEQTKRGPGRPKKSKISLETDSNDENDSLKDLKFDSETKRRAGRPRKRRKNNAIEQSEEELENEDEVKPNRPRKRKENHESEDDSDSKRKAGRPRKNDDNYEPSEDSESEAESRRKSIPDRTEEDENDPGVKRKPGRPKKSRKENSGDEGENYDPNFNSVTEVRSKRYTNFDVESASGYLERLDYLTKVKNKNKEVECAICEKKMAVFVYQKQHMAKHNFLCWLKGENPLDLNNEILVERLLSRVKVHFPKISFACQICGNTKKSARGFISHRQFCGKSQEEKQNLMVRCELCAKVVMPASFETHMAAHNTKKTENPDSEPLSSRQAAEKCLKNISKRSEIAADDSDDDFSEFYNIVKYNKRDYVDIWEEKCLNEETISCPCPNCDFKTDRMTEMKNHFKDCSKNAIKYQCSECDYSSSAVNEIQAHIKELHSLNVSMARQKKDVKDCNFQNGLPFIPYLRNTEHYLHLKVQPSKFFTPAILWTKQQRLIHFSSENLFPNFRVEKSDWEIDNEKNLKNYFQDTEKSLRISLNSENWFTMNKYEVRTEKNLSLIFCGGPVLALAWAPGDGVQYLAVGAHRSMTNVYQVGSTCSDPGNIQIWSFPQMGNKKSSSFENAKLEYLICHESGGAWGMEWCPSGCRDDERLGLLAVNCASGSIPIFSIPIPKHQNYKACKPQPILTLELGPNEKSQCGKISWSKVKPHRIIAGGFVNGYVALWDLTTESFLLKKGRTLYPYRIFQAHHSIITGIVFSPTSDSFLATSSNDKSLKFWDLTDTTCPVSKQSKNSPTDLTWLSHWMSCSTSIENILAAGDFNMTISCIRDFTYEPQTYLSNIDSTSLSIAGNDWLNSLATCFDNGQVNIVCSRRQPLVTHDERRKYVKVIIEPNLFDFDKEAYVVKPKNKQHPKFEISESQSYSETATKYGINFKTNFNFGFEDRLKGNAVNPIHMYPINTANKVCWNPNMDSFTNLAVGYQSGFVFIPKMNFCILDQNVIEGVNKD